MTIKQMNATLPPPDRLYRALVERDSSFEGVFVVGVKSTGIFCRPVCTARKPRPENCEFFVGPKDALHAGYRACLRCRPLDVRGEPPESVRRLVEAVEREPGRRLKEEDVRSMGIDPSTARRQFLRHTGMTFHAYQRARRMGLALADLQGGRSVPRAMRGSGYESFSGFGGAFAGIFGVPPSDAAAAATLVAERIETPLGPMVAIASADGLCLLEFHDRRALEREIEWVRRRFRAAIIPGSNVHTSSIARELGAYFSGARTTFRTPLVIEGSPFQVAAWRELMRIPPGQTRSYAQMAASLGRPGAQRAVGRANGENRLAIVIPCHRVIRSDGSMCGYGGGLWRKQRLLELEVTAMAEDAGAESIAASLSKPGA